MINAQQLIATSGGADCVVDTLLGVFGSVGEDGVVGDRDERVLFEAVQLGIAMLCGECDLVCAEEGREIRWCCPQAFLELLACPA